ncbi:MAG TPA: flagellar basal-body rod protein FlgF [Caldithrix abyssi]|uniref:Flagellar basal-body rod protein FlgF n=1 Tax=Caldithrix abyssi TaxID=187145 RepID=A0A7V1LMI6_CALAY|nr:flagellar basal-body rod protein FlgF [Caldithrix abyssi]
MQFELTKLKQAMMGQVDRNNVVANNLSNVTTAGFKKDEPFFHTLEDELDISKSMSQATDMSQGDLRNTGNPLDLAISGDGFFTVERGDSEVYTRSGSFRIDNDGVLRTRDGLPVLGEGGWINVFSEFGTPSQITITEKGEVFADGELMDRLLITAFENPKALRKAGSNFFEAPKGALPFEMEEPGVKQGFLEDSNVNPAQEMIELIEVQRQFESMQRMVRTLDDVYKSAVNKLGIYR